MTTQEKREYIMEHGSEKIKTELRIIELESELRVAKFYLEILNIKEKRGDELDGSK